MGHTSWTEDSKPTVHDTNCNFFSGLFSFKGEGAPSAFRATEQVKVEKLREMGSLAGEKPHALCFPYPAQGHMNAMLRLAKLLHIKGFHITFLLTEFNHARILRSRGPTALRGLPDFTFQTISDGLPFSDNEDATQDIKSQALALRNNCSGPFRDLLSNLINHSPSSPPVSCIISDTANSCTFDVAAEFGVPDVVFCSFSACALMGFMQYEKLIERGILPLKDESDLWNGYLDTPVDWIPGMKNMRLKDLPSLMRTTDINEVQFKFLLDESMDCYKATAIMINTFDVLEGPVIDALSSMMQLPIYPIGPLNLVSDHDSPLRSVGLNLWKEDSSCLNWLDGREAGSVVYVNFGSLAVVTNEQLVEFAWGLANSGYDFLWVIRPDLVMGDSAVLPEELLKEMSGKSLLASWCPQDAVLTHPAVGGFLTHCGWNSTLESLGAGVPMLCWPFFADQQTNCRYLCAEWGIGMEIDNKVRREEVEVLLRELMKGEKGKEMKKRAVEWKESAINATQPSGRSLANLDKVIQEVLNSQ